MALRKVAMLDELDEEEGHRVEIDGTPVCLVREGDTVRAVHDTCSHQEFSLAEGLAFEGQIECALHGSMFDLETGAPESLPATTPIPVFAVQVEDGAVYVDVERQLNDAPVPEH